MTLSPQQLVLSRRFSSFRPSDRTEILRVFGTDTGIEDVFRALTDFVEEWERANWLEDYAIERIGKWFAIASPEDFSNRIRKWSLLRQTKARKALKRGLSAGASMPVPERLL